MTGWHILFVYMSTMGSASGKLADDVVRKCHAALETYDFAFSPVRPELLSNVKFHNEVSECIARQCSSYEIDFYPNLYFYEHWNARHYPIRHHELFNASVDAISNEEVDNLRSLFSITQNPKYVHVQKDVAVLLVCVPPVCDHPAIVAELVVPYYLRSLGKVQSRLPSAACCVRP